MRTTVRWMLPAAGALAGALALAPHAEASGFFASEPTSPTVVNTPLTWSFAASGGEQCDLSSDVGVTDSSPCGTGQYQYTPTTAGTYTLTVSDPSTAPATTLATSAPVEVHPATPTVTRAGGSDSAPSWSFILPTGATATCTLTQGTTTLSSTSCTDPFTTDLSSYDYAGFTVGVVVHQDGLDSDQGTVSYTLRPPAPDVTLSTPTSSPSNNTQPTFTITDNAAGSAHTFGCSVTGPGGFSTTLAGCDTTATVDLSSAPLDGKFTLHVLETANGTTAATEGTADYWLDRSIAPVSLVLNPTGGGRTVTGHVTESDTDGITFVCTVVQLPSLVPTSCGASTTFDLPASAGEGGYTVKVTATDGAGNTTSDTATYTLDVTGPAVAPTATSTPASPGTGKRVTWTIQPSEAGEAFTCGATTAGASAVCSGDTVTMTITGTDGSYRVTVDTADLYGNPGVSFDLVYVLDTTAPAVPTVSGSATSTGHLRSASWTISDADQGGDLDHYRCAVATPAGGSASATCNAATGQVTLTLGATSPDGSYTVDVYAADALGNETTTPLVLTYLLDTVAPAAARVTPVVKPGSTGSTGFSRSPSWSIGNVEPGATVSCAATGPGGVLAAGRVTCTASSVTLDLSTLADGSYSVTVTVTDAAGNATSSPAVTYLLDTVAPAASSVTPVVKPGSTGTTGFSRSPSWSIGNVEPGATVTCAATGPGGALVAAKVACSSSAVTLNLTGLVDGSYSVTVTVTDAAGNATSSAPVSYLLDTVAPVAASVTPVPGPGSTGTTGFSTSPSWSIGNVEPGATVTCAATGPAGALAAGKVACGSSAVTLNLSGLADGTYSVTVRVTDAAGNFTTSPAVTYVFDTHAPAAPTVIGVAGAGTTGATGYSRSPSWSIGNVEPGATVTCAATGPGGALPVGRITCSGSSVALDLSLMSDGNYQVTVTVTDAAGNATSAAASYLLDTFPPAAATVTATPGPGTTGTTGYSTSPSWSISGVETGATVTCVATGPGGAVAASKVSCGAAAVTLNLSGLADGSYSVTVTVTDAAGNATNATPVTYVLDTVAPPPAALSPATGPGDAGTTGFVRNPSWSLGNVEPGATVTCSATGPSGPLAAARVTCSGPVGLDLSVLADGTYSLTVTVTDAAGNATSTVASYLLDTAAPAAATVTPVAKPGSTGTTGFSRSPSWTVTGVEPGAVISCVATGPGGALAASLVTCGTTVSLNLAGLSDGTYSVTVTLTDAAGNATSSTPASYVLDTVAPAAASVTPVVKAGSTGTTGFSRSPSWSIGNVEPGATVTCAVTGPGGAVAVSRVTCATATVSLDLSTLADGTYSLTVTVTDAAGNATSSPAASYALDTVAPAVPTVSPVVKPGSTGTTGFSRSPSWTVTGVEPGAVISCAVQRPDGTALDPARVICGPTTTLDLGGLADGSYSLVVTLTDAAGNVTNAPQVSYLLDTLAPTAATVTPVVKPGSTGTTGFSRTPSWTVSGVETGATISCTATGPGGALPAAAVSCGPTVTLHLSGLADGTYRVTVTVTDAAGNSTSAAPVTYLLDTVAPAAATVTPVAGPGTTGTTGFSTSPSWTVTGVELGATETCAVTRPDATALSASRISCGSTTQLDLAGLADGTYTLRVTVTDAAGNATTSPAATYVLDTAAPSAPTVTPVAGVGTTGTTGYSRSPSWSVTGVEPGASISCDATGPGGAVAAAAITCGPTTRLDLGGLADGTYTLTVTITDAAGNATSAGAVSYLLDTVAPPAPTVTAVPGPGSTGLTGYSRTPSWSVTDVEPGASITCAVTGPAGALAASAVGCGTTVALNLAGRPDGTYSLVVTVTDAAGNTTSAAAVTYLLDTNPPAAATVTAMPGVGTTGTTGYSPTPSWSVSNVEPGATISCSVSGPAGVVAASLVTCGTTVSLDLSSLTDGTYSLVVTLTDAAGNTTGATAVDYLLDRIAPPAPVLATGSTTPTTDNAFTTSWSIADTDARFDHYLCSVSGPSHSAAAVTCSVSGLVTLTLPSGSPDGTYDIVVTAVDAAGNVSQTALTVDYILDTVAPVAPTVTPVVQPGSTGITGFSRTPSWTVTNVEPGAAYSCRATGPAGAVAASAVTCGPTATLALAGLADGTYLLTVTLTDAAGNSVDAAPVSYVLDTAPPAAAVVTAVAGPGSTGTTGFSRSPSWHISNVEPGAAIGCAVTGPSGVLPASRVGCGSTVTVNLNGMPDGTYTLTVTLTDAAGNTTSSPAVSYVLDTVAPPAPTRTGGTASPANTRAPSWSLVDADPTVTYTCQVSGPAGYSATVACTPATGASLSIAAGSPDGTYVVTVNAVDPAGNVSASPLLFSYVLDTTGPARPTPSAVASPSNARRVTWSLTGTETGETYTCAVDGGASVLCTGPSVQLSLAGLPDGAYTVTVTPHDVLGNPGAPLTLTYVLDTTGPSAPGSTTIASPGSSRSLTWTLRGSESPETYACALTTGSGASVSCSGSTVSLSLAGAADGSYAVTVTPFDALGNPGNPITLTYTLDTTGPVAPSASPVTSPDRVRTVQWTLTGTEPGESYACAVAGTGASVSCDLTDVTLNLAGARDGSYVVTVTPIDALGNPGAALVLGYTLDTTGPVQPRIVSAPSSPATLVSVGWSISDTESLVTYRCAQSGPVAFSLSCGPTVSLTLPAGAPDGVYTITVTPYDALLNAGAPLVLSYVLDTTAPAAPIATIVTPGNDVTPTPVLVVEPGAALTCAIQRYFLPVATVACGTDGTVDLSGYGDGEYEITVRATDAAGNVSAASAQYTYVLDTVAPASPVLTSPASPSPVDDPVWRWNGETATVGTCTITDAAGNVVTGPVECEDLFTGQFAALPDGDYTLSVVLADAAGNLSQPAISVFILDRTAPVPPTVIPPASPSNSTTPRWLITAPRGATLTCTLTRGRTVILGPGACPAGGVVSLTGLPDGTYTMRVTATDTAGNVSAASVTTYVLDTAAPSAPNLVYGSPSSGTSRTPFWGFTLAPGSTGRCELLQNGDVVASRNDCHGAVRFTINGPDGSYTLRIVSVDAAGNVSAPLLVGYELMGHGGGSGSVGGSVGGSTGVAGGRGHQPPAGGPEPKPPAPLQRIIDHLGGLTGQAAKAVRKAANTATAALPSLPAIHDPLTNNVSHAVQNVINAVSKAGGGTGFPLLLLVVVALFLMAQSRMDRRDPKLALASVAADDNLQFGPPPSRGDAG